MRQLSYALAILLLVLTAPGQVMPDGIQSRRAREPRFSKGPGEFTFVRTIYNSPYRSRGRGSWATDFPEADYHFIAGIRFWSDINLDVPEQPKQIEILDERLFNYP